MKKLNNTEAELKKSVPYKKKRVTEKNKIFKTLMETQAAVPNVIADLKQKVNALEQKIAKHLS